GVESWHKCARCRVKGESRGAGCASQTNHDEQKTIPDKFFIAKRKTKTMLEKSTTDLPFSGLHDYQEALNKPLYSEDSEAGRLYRKSVNAELAQSPNILPGPNDMKIRQDWLDKDGVQQ